MRRSLLCWLPAVLLVALGGAPAAQASGGPDIQVVAAGLSSPRHLAFGARGDLFVAEAGRGGDDFCFAGAEGPACMGATGAVTEVDRHGHQFRIIDGLMTNFHLPHSSLLLLVSALTGRERLLSAYASAMKLRYRFYSFGDAMLVL